MIRIIFTICVIIIGCKMYTPLPQILPQHIKSIAIKPFVNSTSTLGLEDRLTYHVTQEFLQNVSYNITSEDKADGYVTGEIVYYNIKPIEYDQNQYPLQYKLYARINIYFVDKIKNVTLWEEKNFEETYLYYIATMPGGMTEEEAREIVWKSLAQKIVKRIIGGFGTVTGTSEKKIQRK